MEFENLQAIWDTQNDKPVFAMQDARLVVALYQQRERSRRRAFRLHFAPMYVAALAMLAAIGSLIANFRNIDSLMRRYKAGSRTTVSGCPPGTTRGSRLRRARCWPLWCPCTWNERSTNEHRKFLLPRCGKNWIGGWRNSTSK